MKTQNIETKPLVEGTTSSVPEYRVTITGVGSKVLPLPYAWAILFDSFIKGMPTQCFDEHGEVFVEITANREIVGDAPGSSEFRNWADLMFKFFQGYVAVLGAPQAPAPAVQTPERPTPPLQPELPPAAAPDFTQEPSIPEPVVRESRDTAANETGTLGQPSVVTNEAAKSERAPQESLRTGARRGRR